MSDNKQMFGKSSGDTPDFFKDFSKIFKWSLEHPKMCQSNKNRKWKFSAIRGFSSYMMLKKATSLKKGRASENAFVICPLERHIWTFLFCFEKADVNKIRYAIIHQRLHSSGKRTLHKS